MGMGGLWGVAGEMKREMKDNERVRQGEMRF
jgi:hypothetical protein